MIGGFRLMQKRIDAINRVLREQITGIRVVRAFVREPYETARFAEANCELTETALRLGRLQSLMFPTVMLVVNSSSVAVLWFGAHLIDDGRMQVGSLTAYLSYLLQILMSVMMATFMAILVPRAAVCAERIGEVLDTESSVLPPAEPVIGLGSDRAIWSSGRSIPLSRGGRAGAARDQLQCRPGERTAVIGSTGAGKSTLIGLDPAAVRRHRRARCCWPGRTSGRSIRTCCARAVGLVPQRAYLFSGTVASNLRYGKPAATDEELWQALEVAQAADFVRAMPEGLDAADRPGRHQRLRRPAAAAGDRPGAGPQPRMYLFDDAFSALDLATDARLRAALRPLTEQATVLIVAQRVSTIVDADQILVLDDGRIVGRGRHQELLASCPTYAEIVAVAVHRGRAGGVGMSEHRGERERERVRTTSGTRRPASVPGAPAAARPGRPPMARGPFAGMGPAEKSMHFWPSGRRLLGRLAPERRRDRRWCWR